MWVDVKWDFFFKEMFGTRKNEKVKENEFFLLMLDERLLIDYE